MGKMWQHDLTALCKNILINPRAPNAFGRPRSHKFSVKENLKLPFFASHFFELIQSTNKSPESHMQNRPQGYDDNVLMEKVLSRLKYRFHMSLFIVYR